jgi:hypothetical protein
MALKRIVDLFERKTECQRRYKAPERRECIRFEYPPEHRPVFRVRNKKLKIIDISEQGLKLLNDKQVKLGAMVHGSILFLNGKSMEITGKIVWEHDNQIGLLLAPLPPSVILAEIRNLMRTLGLSEKGKE